MLITIFLAVALVSGGLFGFYVFRIYDNHRKNLEQKSLIETIPTHMLKAELEKRGTDKESAYR